MSEKTRVFELRMKDTKGPVLVAQKLDELLSSLDHEDHKADPMWWEIRVRYMTKEELDSVGEFNGW